jgi:hypothetical protein
MHIDVIQLMPPEAKEMQSEMSYKGMSEGGKRAVL